MSQNIDATLNRSMNNRTTNNGTISMENDNYLTLGDCYAAIGQYSASDVGTDELHHFRHILSVNERTLGNEPS